MIASATSVVQALNNAAATNTSNTGQSKDVIIDNKSPDINSKLDKLSDRFEKNIDTVVSTLNNVDQNLNAKLDNVSDRFETNIQAIGSIISNSIKQIANKQEETATEDKSAAPVINSNTTVNKPQQAVDITADLLTKVIPPSNTGITTDSLTKVKPPPNIGITADSLTEVITPTKIAGINDTIADNNIEKIGQALNILIGKYEDEPEESKWVKISEIIGKTIKIGKYVEGPEAEKIDVRDKISDVVSVDLPLTKTTTTKTEVEEKEGMGIFGKLGLITAAIAAFVAFAPKIKEIIPQIKEWWEENKPVIMEAFKVIGDLLYIAFEKAMPVLWDAIKIAAGLLWDAITAVAELLFEKLKLLGPVLLTAIAVGSIALIKGITVAVAGLTGLIPAFGAGFLGIIPMIGTALLGILAVGAGAAIGSIIGKAVGGVLAPDNAEIAALSPEEKQKAVQDVNKERDARLAKLTPVQLKAMDDADAARRVARNAKKTTTAATPANQPTVPIVDPNTDNKSPTVIKETLEFKINKQPKELQDFIIKGNDVYSFNNKDEILGMKDGGAVKQLLSSNSQNNDKQLFIANKQVSILEQIRDGIMVLTNVKNNGNKTTNINTNTAGSQRSIPSSTFLRSDFNAAHNLQPI
jgi:small nuclear ribonucleoprotein (snRNP)-like protein